ncbi:MAG: SGNH/GDSL hydrolase family protein [Planctomycetes bacterium]|nr:SGNH/GDSL hydrolase family protein [Planctomycetota bacterium]
MSQTTANPRRAIIGFTAIAILPLFFLIDSAVGLVRGWHITYGQEKAILAGMVGLLAAALLLFVTPRGKLFLAQRWPHLFCLLVIFLLGVAGLEFAARHMQAEEAPFHLRQPSHTWLFRPDPAILPGLSPESRYTTNRDGVRGTDMPPRDQAIRILCLGGSTTECLYLDDSRTWTHLLVGELNASPSKKPAWVGSAGASGMTSEAHVEFIRTSRLMDQIDVLVVMMGVNDLAKSLVPDKPGEGGGGEVRRPELIGRPLWRQSKALIEAGVIVKRLRQRITEGSIIYEDVGGESYIQRRARRQQAKLVDDVSDLTGPGSMLAKYPERIAAIIDACKAHNVTVYFVTQPVLWSENSPPEAQKLFWFGWRADGSYLSVKALCGLMDRYNAALRETCAARGVVCIDLSSMNGKQECFYDDCHFTEAGARQVAKLIPQGMR